MMESAQSGVTVTRTARIWLADDGIIRWIALPDSVDTGADAVASVRAIAERVGDAKRPVLIDIRLQRGHDREARETYGSEPAGRLVSAVALVVGTSPLARMLANFFLRSRPAVFPVRLFDSEAEALAWLHGFLP
jgi:hypothetical protein